MAVSRKYSSSKKQGNQPKNVSRADIEKKLKEIDSIIDDATNTTADLMKFAVGVGVVIVVALAFYSGRKRALRNRTLITFTKLK